MPWTASSTAASAPSAPTHGLLGWFERRWVSMTRSSVRDDHQTAHNRPAAGPTHLVILVNGLFGAASNWDVMCEQLRQHLPPDTLLHPSTVNARFATYQGIDNCGQRLADEIRTVAASQPSLTRLSVVAHSMGGLMARYALGSLFNPDQGRVCGLEPAHFVSMATPHCGCDADGVAQVPFIGWTGDIPLLGQQLYRFLASISGSTASLIFQRTGQQFFLLDGAAPAVAGGNGGAAAGGAGSDRAAVAKAATAAAADRDAAATAAVGSNGSSTASLPLLLQMTQDCPDRGLYFYSALAAFKTRTAYANMDGDHLVGFANSSLRSFDQLPPPPPTAATAKGVVLQDRLSAAFWPHDWQGLGQQWSSSRQQQQQQQELGAAASRPYAGSRDWSRARQQQQQQRGFATTAGAASKPQSGASGLWQVLTNKGSTVSAGEGGDSQQQQQQQDAEHASGALAALELEAGGAGPAATAAVAAVGAAAGSSGSSGSPAAAAAAAVTSPDDLHYSRFRSQPGRGGVPLKTAAAAAAAAAAEMTDSADEVLDLHYRNPLSPEPGQQQQQNNALSSADFQQRQQQQQQGGATPAATAASGAAALAAAEADLASGLSRQGSGPLAVAGSPAQAAADVAADASRLAAAAGSSGRAEVVSHMLQRLQELPWRRIDVSFQGARFGFAHNNIQVTRRWWNFEGVAVPAHLAQQLQLMDALLLGPEGKQQQQPEQQQ